MRNRSSIRLKDYDYTQEGTCFVTICTHQRGCLFGAITNGEMELNSWGDIVQDQYIHNNPVCWEADTFYEDS